jgi:hypothetical protein
LFISNTAKVAELFSSVPVSCTECKWLIIPSYWRGPVFRTRHTDRLSWRRVFCFFSVPRGHCRDCTSYLDTVISFRILPNILFTTHPDILCCVVIAAANVVV